MNSIYFFFKVKCSLFRYRTPVENLTPMSQEIIFTLLQVWLKYVSTAEIIFHLKIKSWKEMAFTLTDVRTLILMTFPSLLPEGSTNSCWLNDFLKNNKTWSVMSFILRYCLFWVRAKKPVQDSYFIWFSVFCFNGLVLQWVWKSWSNSHYETVIIKRSFLSKIPVSLDTV